MLSQQMKASMEMAESAQAQEVYLEQAQIFNIVFVPLNDRPTFHGGVLDRNQLADRVAAQ